MLNKIITLNPNLSILSLNDTESIKKYGRKIDFDFSSHIDFMKQNTSLPSKGTLYLPHVEGAKTKDISTMLYGNMPVQVGVCHGNGHTLNGLEYHMGSEITVAMTDLVLLVAHRDYMQNDQLDSKYVEGIYLYAGEAIELFQTTLHYAPAKVSDAGYMSIIILPEGTNYDLKQPSNDKLLAKTNKWLILHKEHKKETGKDGYAGIVGENITLNY